MELILEYKQTDIGPVPEDWKCENLGELTLKVGSGITPRGGERVYKETGRPFIRSQNVGWGRLLLDDIAYIDGETHASFAATEVRAGDVLLNITGASIGRSAVADRFLAGGNVNQHVCIVRTEPLGLDPYYLNQFLLSRKGQGQIDSFQAGGNRQGLNFGQIRSIKVPVPRIEEQRAIATALSDVDALIAALDKLIAKKRAIKTATMQQLLTGKQRLPGFAEKWATRRLGDVFELLLTGGQPRAMLSKTGEVKYIHYGDVHSHTSAHFDCEVIDLPFIVHDKVRNLPLLEEGDLVMVDASEDYDGIGKSYEIRNINGHKVVAGLHTLLLRGNKAYVSDGFKGYLQFIPSIREQLIKIATGISVYGISKIALIDVELLLPPVDEQRAIALVLSDMDAEIEALEARRDKTKQIKQGMMHELLTGKTRLV